MELKGYDLPKNVRTTFNECLKRNIKGILCLDFALGYHGLSTFSYMEFPCYFMALPNTTEKYISSNISYQLVSKLDMRNIIKIKDGIFVTNPERTLCDMIKYDRHEYHLLEALDAVYQDDVDSVDKSLLESLVDEYNIRERFEELKEESKHIWEEG